MSALVGPLRRERGQVEPAALAVHELRARPATDIELEWFFNQAESDLGACSNYIRMLGPCFAEQDRRSPEDVAEAARAYRIIRGWLRAMPNADAGVLQAAYETRLWPRRLMEELGVLTGVVVRLACALDPWPEDRNHQEALERVRAEWLASECEQHGPAAALGKLRRGAQTRFALAVRALISVRGPRRCLRVCREGAR